jgi:hypothetical protein
VACCPGHAHLYQSAPSINAIYQTQQAEINEAQLANVRLSYQSFYQKHTRPSPFALEFIEITFSMTNNERRERLAGRRQFIKPSIP